MAQINLPRLANPQDSTGRFRSDGGSGATPSSTKVPNFPSGFDQQQNQQQRGSGTSSAASTNISSTTNNLPPPSEMYISVRRDFAVLIGRQLNALSPVMSSLLDTIFWGSPIKSIAHIIFFSIGSYYHMCGIRFFVVLFWGHVFLIAVWNKVSEGAASALPGAGSSTTTTPSSTSSAPFGSPRGSISAFSNAPRMSPAEIQQCLRAYKVLTINAGRLIRRYPALFNRTSSFWMCVTVSLLFFDLVICEVLWGTSLFYIIDTLLAPIAACTVVICYGIADPRHTLTYNVRHQHTMPPRTELPTTPSASQSASLSGHPRDFSNITANPGDSISNDLLMRNDDDANLASRNSVSLLGDGVGSSSVASSDMDANTTLPAGAENINAPVHNGKREMSYTRALGTMRPFAPNKTPDGTWDTPESDGGLSFKVHPTVPMHVHKIFNILMRGPEWQIWKNYVNTKEYRKFCPLPHTATKGITTIAPRCDPTAPLPQTYKMLLEGILKHNDAPTDDLDAAHKQLQKMRAEANQKEESTEPELLAMGHVVPWSVVKCSYNCLRIRCPSMPSAPANDASRSILRRFDERGMPRPATSSEKTSYRDRRLFQHVVDWLDDDDGTVDSNQLNVYQYDKLLGDYRRLKFHKFPETIGEPSTQTSEKLEKDQQHDTFRWVRMRVVHYLYKQLVFAVSPRDAPVFTTATETSPEEVCHYGAFGTHKNTFFPERLLSKTSLLALETAANVAAAGGDSGGAEMPVSFGCGPQGTIYHVCSAETDAPAVPGHVRTNIHRQAFIVVAPPLRRHVVLAEYCAQEGLAIPDDIRSDMMRGISSDVYTPSETIATMDDTDGEDQVVLVITMICGEPGGRVPASIAEIGRGEQVKIVNTIKDKLYQAIQQAL